MNYAIVPVIDVYELEDALTLQYGREIFEEHEGLDTIIFNGEENNRSFRTFHFSAHWDYAHPVKKLLHGYLKDIFPNYDCCIITCEW